MFKHKKIFVVIFLVLVLIPTIAFAYFMVIDTIQNKMGAVYFDHHNHLDTTEGVGMPCNKCHHELKTPEQKPTACSLKTCHVKENPKDQNIENPVSVLKEAYHLRCRGCHKEVKKKYKKAPDTSDCNLCHIKEVDNFIKERTKKNNEK